MTETQKQLDTKFKNESGQFIVNDSETFIKLLQGDEEEGRVLYKMLSDFAFKQKNKLAPEVPPEDYGFIVNFAIVKAINGFKESKGARLQSYFWEKIRGEVSAFRAKRDSLQKKVYAAMENGSEGDHIEYAYQKDGSGANGDQNALELVDMESIEDKSVRQETYRRQIKAFKMAFSGVPKELQFIMNELASGKKIKQVAEFLKLESTVVSQKRNYALSLIFQRIMRGNHLNTEEKSQMAELHGFVYHEEDFADLNSVKNKQVA